MAATPSPDFSMSHQPPGENSNIQLNQTTQIIIENGSNDITISKCEQNSPTPPASGHGGSSGVPLKTQMLPLVYIKNGTNKIPFPTPKRPGAGNFIISTSSTLVTNKPTTSLTTIPISTGQNVVIGGRARPLMLPKQPIALMPQGAKVGTYVTMLKPASKPEIQVCVGQTAENNTHIDTVKDITSLPQSTIMLKNDSGVTKPQKFILAGPIPKLSKARLITPMPKLQNFRPPVTSTTDSLQSTKFTVLPVSVPQNDGPLGQKVFNFQISDGKILSNVATPVTIMCDSNKNIAPEAAPTSAPESICKKPPEKNDISNKTYELSIADDESESNQSDPKLVVSSADSNSSIENNCNANKQPSKFTHGVSILKKSYTNNLFADTKKNESPIICASAQSCSSSLTNDITVFKPSTGVEERVSVAVPIPAVNKKPEQRSRRKAQFQFRKDFDDFDVSFPDDECNKTPLSPVISENNDVKTEEKKVLKSEVLQEQCNSNEKLLENIKEEFSHQGSVLDPQSILDIKSSCESDAAKLLQWEENIGCLPESNIKFFMNEFGILEYLSEEDYQKILEKKIKRAKEKEDLEREVQCLECDCYGILADFVDANFCSLDCQMASRHKYMKEPPEANAGNPSSTLLAKPSKRKFTIKSKSDVDIKPDIKAADNRCSADEETSNEGSHDKFSYPWECKKKGFSWSKYLVHLSATAAPVKLFKDPFPYSRNLFKPGMKLEGVDPQHQSYFCVLTVADTIGYRIRLHFDGYSESYDFWTYADSPNIFPMGWCEKYGHLLRPPPGYTENTFVWLHYLRVTKSTAASKHLFVNRSGQAICPNGFRIGMKLEAVDKTNSALICVATVRDMMDNRILVHFDGWDDIYDYWADPTSPYIHPVGWCEQYGHDLTPPSDYPTPETFTWEKYLKETKSIAAPVRAFKQRPACGFRRGMRLECVDKRVPHLIRVATVDDVNEHQIRIQFDGWPDRYCYWVDDDSPDIHPVGWCQKTGHPLEPPLTPDDVYHFLDCPTVGCRGEGHIDGMRFRRHSTQENCPYAEPNIDAERSSRLPDRLLSPSRSPEAKEPVSIQARQKQKYSKRPKWVREFTMNYRGRSMEPPEKKPRRRLAKKQVNKEQDEDKIHEQEATAEEKARSFIEDSKILPAERESWKKHSSFLSEFLRNNTAGSPQNWSKGEVHEFVTSVPGCDMNGDTFVDHEIDGEAFWQLSQSDLLHILNFKMGPAVKLYNIIVLLRERYCDRKRRK